MLNPAEPAYQKTLANGLTLRTVSTAEELDRVAGLSAAIHEESVGEMTRKIFARHPLVSGRDLAYIEDGQGEVIATLCLIPWTLRFGPVDLPAAELGIVGTQENWRGRGLNRELMGYFWQRCEERGALLSIIQGIPYFYRQYGYEYAMLPLEGGYRIQPDQIPAPPAAGYSTRLAAANDIPLLARLYDAWAGALDLSAARGEAVWRYLLERTPAPEAMQHDTYILLDPGGAPAGYFRIADYHFYPNLLTLDEVSPVDFFAGAALLDHLKALARRRGKDGIRLHLPQSSGLVRLARSFGAVDLGPYSWQVRIFDQTAFLRRLAPLFEQRLAGSLFAGLSGTYSINLYKEVIGLTFREGRLIDVGPAVEDERAFLNIPPLQFIPLVLGGRSLDEIHAAFPDAYALGPWKLLAETLFPKTNAFLATVY